MVQSWPMGAFKILFEIVVLGIIVGLTVEVFKPAIPYLPCLWLGTLAYLTWKVLTSKYVIVRASKYKHKLSSRKRMISYIVVIIAGGILFYFYWWGLNTIFAPMIASYEAEQRKKESPEKSTPSHPTPPSPVSKNINELSNKDLRNEIIQFGNKLREFENNFSSEEYKRLNEPLKTPFPEQFLSEEEKSKMLTIEQKKRDHIYNERREEYRKEFMKRYLGKSITYRNELIKRLNIIPPREEKDIPAFQAFLVGPVPISDLATYLDHLAMQLPDSE